MVDLGSFSGNLPFVNGLSSYTIYNFIFVDVFYCLIVLPPPPGFSFTVYNINLCCTNIFSGGFFFSWCLILSWCFFFGRGLAFAFFNYFLNFCNNFFSFFCLNSIGLFLSESVGLFLKSSGFLVCQLLSFNSESFSFIGS